MGTKEHIVMGDGLKLLQRLRENSDLTLDKLSDELGISISTLKRLVRKMRSIGVKIENSGSRRKPSYHVVDWGIINVEVLSVHQGVDKLIVEHSVENTDTSVVNFDDSDLADL